MGCPRPLFVYFVLFTQQLQKKLKASAGFEMGLSQLKAIMLTTRPPPRPLYRRILANQNYPESIEGHGGKGNNDNGTNDDDDDDVGCISKRCDSLQQPSFARHKRHYKVKQS